MNRKNETILNEESGQIFYVILKPMSGREAADERNSWDNFKHLIANEEFCFGFWLGNRMEKLGFPIIDDHPPSTAVLSFRFEIRHAELASTDLAIHQVSCLAIVLRAAAEHSDQWRHLFVSGVVVASSTTFSVIVAGEAQFDVSSSGHTKVENRENGSDSSEKIWCKWSTISIHESSISNG